MKVEFDAFIQNGIWELILSPKNGKMIINKRFAPTKG